MTYKNDIFYNDDGSSKEQIVRRILDGEYLLVQTKPYLDTIISYLTNQDHLGIILVNSYPWLVGVLKKDA